MNDSSEPRWLDADEQRVWVQLSTMILRLQPVLSAQLQLEFGVSHFEYLVMARLSETAGATIRLSALAKITGSSLPRLSQAVTRLEKRKWLTRRPDTADGRYTLAVLTRAGRRRLEQMAPSHIEDIREYVFDRLTHAQVRQLGVISQRVLDGLPPDDSWPSASVP